jgi:hypothetical protein
MGRQACVSPSPPVGARETKTVAPVYRAKNLPQKGWQRGVFIYRGVSLRMKSGLEIDGDQDDEPQRIALEMG